jgi:hypothetical protein
MPVLGWPKPRPTVSANTNKLSLQGTERFMQKILRSAYLFLFLLSGILHTYAQTGNYPYPVARDRMLFHDDVDREQKRLLLTDGGMGDTIRLSRDEDLNIRVTQALIAQVDKIQKQIELDTTLNTNFKKRYLIGLKYLLLRFREDYRKPDFPLDMAPDLVDAFEKAMELDRKNESIEPVIAENRYGIGKILIDCFLYPSENPGTNASKIILFRKYCGLHPPEILSLLRNNLEMPFTDSLIVVAGHNNIRQLYDYAAGNNPLGWRIKENRDTLVHIIAQMATSKSGQLYFPFLDNLLKGKISIEDIDRVKGNELEYFRLLVKTRIDYAARLLPPLRDTALEMDVLKQMLAKKGRDVFVNVINALHTQENPAIRFKVLDPLTPEELYYLVVLNENEIYTSSYLGVYDRIFQRMASPRGDSLIMRVHGDFFRKFIKMAAAYNKLDHFLGTMDKEHADAVTWYFAFGLEKAGEEEAVDVADSYSSIFEKNPDLAAYVLRVVKWNYEKSVQANNKRGTIIYNLLQTLFESADTSKKIDISARLGIPPIYSVDYNALKDAGGRVIEQVFFYGDKDKDGQNSFADYMALFRKKPEWKISENPEWVTINSVKGKPVWIFANKPLLGDDDPDAKAQEHLNDYLAEHGLKPTIVIHRGHSYHVRYTIEQMAPTAHIIVLGSCGGYNNLSEVLKISEDAHIISSKQVGTKTVNEPILEAINNCLLAGKNIDWLAMWKELRLRFRNGPAAKEKFDDYIPPYMNLGAIFIKAYRKAMSGEE